MKARPLQKNLKFIFVLGSILTLSACQTTSDLAGKTSLNLSRGAADLLEVYFSRSDSAAYAANFWDGRGSRVWCKHVTCSYPNNQTAAQYAISLCEKGNTRCGLLALGREIVWEGPIRLPKARNNVRTFRLTKRTEGSRSITNTGQARAPGNEGKGQLFLTNSDGACSGEFDIQTKTWYLKCLRGPEYKGSIEVRSDGQLTGTSADNRTKIDIITMTWPNLRQKIAEHEPSWTAEWKYKLHQRP